MGIKTTIAKKLFNVDSVIHTTIKPAEELAWFLGNTTLYGQAAVCSYGFYQSGCSVIKGWATPNLVAKTCYLCGGTFQFIGSTTGLVATALSTLCPHWAPCSYGVGWAIKKWGDGIVHAGAVCENPVNLLKKGENPVDLLTKLE